MCSIFQSLENYGKIANLFCNYITLQKKKKRKKYKIFQNFRNYKFYYFNVIFLNKSVTKKSDLYQKYDIEILYISANIFTLQSN